MDVSLSEETRKLIEERVRRGGFSSADELVKAALKSFEELEWEPLSEEVLDAIDEAEAQVERGEVRDWSEVREELLAKYGQK
jgi:putative addiction module CopG family antidote